MVRKRRVPRRSFFHKIGLLVDGNYYITSAVELGEGGIGLYSPMPLPVGKRVVVTFKVPMGSPTAVRGIVRYVSPMQNEKAPRYGIEFLTLEFLIRREIRNFVASKDQAETFQTLE